MDLVWSEDASIIYDLSRLVERRAVTIECFDENDPEYLQSLYEN